MPLRVDRTTVLHCFDAATQAVLNAWACGLRRPAFFGSAPRPLLKYIPIPGTYNDLSAINAIKFNNAVLGRQEIHIAFPIDRAGDGSNDFFEDQRTYCAGIASAHRNAGPDKDRGRLLDQRSGNYQVDVAT